MFVDVFLESFVVNIHLAKPRENLVGASVVVGGDMSLKLCHKCLNLGRIGIRTAILARGKLCKDRH